MQQFTNPRFVYHGEDALSTFKKLKGKKAIICIGGGSIKRNGFLKLIEKNLKKASFVTKLFEGIESDPSVETMNKGAAGQA